jgi:hypothetical protein
MMPLYVMEMLLQHLQLRVLLQQHGYGVVKELGLMQLQLEQLLEHIPQW